MSEPLLPDCPEKPLPSDCCNSGCTPCILDVYDNLMKQWEDECNRIKSSAGRCDSKSLVKEPSLLQTKYCPFRIDSIKSLTNDTSIFRFQSVNKASGSDGLLYKTLENRLDLKPSQYLILQGKDTIEGKENIFSRAYTPISNGALSIKGCFDVVIKMYPTGRMSQYLQKLCVGDITLWRGPYGGLSYEPNKFRHILMLCAGTGIAPMYSLASSIVKDERDDTMIKILFCCKDEANIILREEIHTLRSFWNFSADIYLPYCKSNCKPLYGETFKTARLGQDAIAFELKSKISDNILVLICGSPDFCKTMHQLVSQCNIEPNHIHVFE